MSLVHSVSVLGAMLRATLPTITEGVRGTVQRATVDARARAFGQRVITLLDLDVHVHGGETLDPNAAYVYLANHQSHLDIPILYATLPSHTLRMVGKKELFAVPWWGRGLQAAGFIAIDRSNKTQAYASIERAKTLVREGVSIYLAPEGTRSRDGRLAPLKRGGFHLAADTGAPIVPVAIDGTLAVMPPGHATMHPGKRIDVTIGAPLASDAPLATLVAEVEKFLREHVRQPAS